MLFLDRLVGFDLSRGFLNFASPFLPNFKLNETIASF